MDCPHCRVQVNPGFDEKYLGRDNENEYFVITMICPNSDCKKMIVKFVEGTSTDSMNRSIRSIRRQYLVRPQGATRPVPTEVDEKFTKVFSEACVVLPLSETASAALSRRCLQNLLREKGGVKPSDLSNEIQEILDGKSLPTAIAENLDAIRAIGNFAAHPVKSKNTGEIIEVEPHEAEWLIDVIESLFDFYFVQPSKAEKKRTLLNAKLKEAGKPSLKQALP